MTKVSGSYASIVRGVSQQVPESRLDGQVGEQINFISDPVEGLARRRGTRNIHESLLATAPNAATLGHYKSFRGWDFSILATDYTLLHCKGPRPVGSTAPAVVCYNKTTNTVMPLVFPPGDAELDLMERNGVSALAQLGRYTLIAWNNYVNTGFEIPLWDVPENASRAAIWIRGGAYNRKFTATATVGGVSTVAVYTTPSAGYPGTLDTSDIATSDPDYQKKVNDRVNAYDSAVTAWITTAANGSSPEGIATGLLFALVAAGAAGAVTRYGNTILTAAALTNLDSLTVDDGGDGSLVRVVAQTIKDATELMPRHIPGKIVKVQAKAGAPAYYLKAIATSQIDAFTGSAEVRWEESAGSAFSNGSPVAIATVEGGNIYVASDPAKLQALLPSLVVPQGNARPTGDGESNPAPFWANRSINYLGSYQDRLVVGAGAVISMSEVGNYFNFFRTSVLTVVDSDPVEVYALGSEDDMIRHSVIFDKSLLLFGDQQQYSINGRVPVTPATSSVIQSSAHEDTTLVRPVATGDLVFYVKEREGFTQAYQINIGDVADTSNSSEITQQLTSYIPGSPVEFITTTTPNMMLLRTDMSPTRVFVYRYLDTSGGRERLMDSWSTWEFSPLCGSLCGMSTVKGQPLLFFIRDGLDAGGTSRAWLSVDKASLLAALDSTPYVDSQRPYSAVATGASTRSWHTQAGLSTAYSNVSAAFMQGTPSLASVPGLIAAFPAAPAGSLVTGADFDASVTPTNPFTRDRNGKPVNTGRLTVTHFDISYKQTGGLIAEVKTAFSLVTAYSMSTSYSLSTALNFNGHSVGASSEIVGVQPISQGIAHSYVGRETRDYELTLKAKTWLPATLTAFEWTGQYFYNARRT